MTTNQSVVNQENVAHVPNGWVMLIVVIAILIADIAWAAIVQPQDARIGIMIAIFAMDAILMRGFFSLQPNQARVLVLFGAYKGTVRTSGFHWANPFYSNGRQLPGSVKVGTRANAVLMGQVWGPSTRNKLSLRARTQSGDKLKVNDKRGNPIEIAAVVVWRIQDTAQAFFDVDDYENYVPIQSESALRHLASIYVYDGEDENEPSLRGNVDEVSAALKAELQERLSKAGVVVDEARLTDLAYAPEIAQVMLRRQQAEAVIAARTKIVQGAVSMVDMALTELAEKHVVELDDERRAAMVSNLMVVLCSESEVHPVVNTGTLYT